MIFGPGTWQQFINRHDNIGLPEYELRHKYLREQEESDALMELLSEQSIQQQQQQSESANVGGGKSLVRRSSPETGDSFFGEAFSGIVTHEERGTDKYIVTYDETMTEISSLLANDIHSINEEIIYPTFYNDTLIARSATISTELLLKDRISGNLLNTITGDEFITGDNNGRKSISFFRGGEQVVVRTGTNEYKVVNLNDDSVVATLTPGINNAERVTAFGNGYVSIGDYQRIVVYDDQFNEIHNLTESEIVRTGEFGYTQEISKDAVFYHASDFDGSIDGFDSISRIDIVTGNITRQLIPQSTQGWATDSFCVSYDGSEVYYLEGNGGGIKKLNFNTGDISNFNDGSNLTSNYYLESAVDLFGNLYVSDLTADQTSNRAVVSYDSNGNFIGSTPETTKRDHRWLHPLYIHHSIR